MLPRFRFVFFPTAESYAQIGSFGVVLGVGSVQAGFRRKVPRLPGQLGPDYHLSHNQNPGK